MFSLVTILYIFVQLLTVTFFPCSPVGEDYDEGEPEDEGLDEIEQNEVGDFSLASYLC